MSLSPAWFSTLTGPLAAPLVVAPMTGVSSPALVDAVTSAGVAGSFPTHAAASTEQLSAWLGDLAARPGPRGPVLPNLVVHRTNPRREADLAVVCAAAPPAVICSVGSPAAVVPALHEAGIAVLADVGSVDHARRALAAGADGLVLLAAGAGGQTGWANPFAFIEEVRRFFDGPTVLAGGVGTGRAVAAAQVAGYDLAYVGTPFIATPESAASDAWRAAVVGASLDDIELTDAFTGIGTSMIRDPEATSGTARGTYDASVVTGSGGATAPTRFSAGHVAGTVDDVLPAGERVARIVREYRAVLTAR